MLGIAVKDTVSDELEAPRPTAKVIPIGNTVPASFPLGRRWHVIYTNIRCEFRANLGLKAKGFETFLPYVRKRIRHGKMTHVVDRPLFPRYMFVRFDIEADEWFHPIKSTDGVEDLIRNGSLPVRVSDIELGRLIAAQNAGDFDETGKKIVVSDFEVGEVARISEGPFMGFNATVLASMPERERAEVMLQFLGRASKITLPYAGLEKL